MMWVDDPNHPGCQYQIRCRGRSGSGGSGTGSGPALTADWNGMGTNVAPSTEGQVGASQDYGSGYGGVNIAYFDRDGNDWTALLTGLPTDGSVTVTLTNLTDSSTIATFTIIGLVPQTGPPDFITLRSASPGDVPDLSSAYPDGIGVTIS